MASSNPEKGSVRHPSTRFSQIVPGEGGDFDGVHNDLSGRSTADAHPASAISVDAANFEGNLNSDDNTVQKVADALDALVAGAGVPRVLVCDENRRYDIGRLEDGRPEFTHIVVTTGTKGDPQVFGIMLPAAEGTYDEIRIVPGPDDGVASSEDDINPFWIAVESVELVGRSAAGLDITNLFSLAINESLDMEPTLIQTAITIEVNGQETTATLDDTFSNVIALLTALGTGWQSGIEGWDETVEVTSEWESGLWVRTRAEGDDQSITVVSATNGDPLGALGWATIAGADGTEETVVRGVLNRADGTLGAPGVEDGGTHNMPNSTDPHFLGITLVDAEGAWSNIGWANRSSLSDGALAHEAHDGPLAGHPTRLANTLQSLAMFVDPWERTVDPTSEAKSYRPAPVGGHLTNYANQDFVLTLCGTSPDPGETPHGLAFELPAADDAHRHVAILKRPHDDTDGDVTVSAESGQIDGADDLTLNPGDCAVLYSTAVGEGYAWTVRALHRHLDAGLQHDLPGRAILDIYPDDATYQVTRDESGRLSHSVVRINPGNGSPKIRIPAPAGTGQTIAFGAERDGFYAGETLWWERDEPPLATQTTMSMAAVFGWGGGTIDTVITVDADGTPLVVDLSGTYGDGMELLFTKLLPELGAAALPEGFGFASFGSGDFGMFSLIPGDHTLGVTVTSGTDPVGFGSMTATVGDAGSYPTMLPLDSLASLSFPLTVDTTIKFELDGVEHEIVLDDTFDSFADLTEALMAFNEDGWSIRSELDSPWVNSSVLFRTSILDGEPGTYEFVSYTNSDDLGAAWANLTPIEGSVAPPEEWATVVHGVIAGDDTTGTLGNGGSTHTSPTGQFPHWKGLILADGDDGWIVVNWPWRLGTARGTWPLSIGPTASPDGVNAQLQWMLEQLQAVAVNSQRVVADTTLPAGGATPPRTIPSRITIDTSVSGDPITVTLPDADGDGRAYRLQFTRNPGDDAGDAATITDGDGFSVTVAPGETIVVESLHVGWVNSSLDPGWSEGQLDDPANKIYGWRQTTSESYSYAEIRHIAHREVDSVTYNTSNESGAQVELSYAVGEYFNVVMTENSEITFVCFGNPIYGGETTNFYVKLSGAYTPTWDERVEWPEGVAPSYSGNTTLYRFISFDSGATIQGMVLGEDFSVPE